jgi:hypothetical protein
MVVFSDNVENAVVVRSWKIKMNRTHGKAKMAGIIM